MDNIGTFFQTVFLQGIAMALAALLIPKFRITGVSGPFLMVIALSLVNTFFWDSSLFHALPDSFSTRAAALVLANALVFWVLVKLLPAIEIEGFLPAIVAPVVFTICSLIVTQDGKDIEWKKVIVEGVQTAREARDYFLERDGDPERARISSPSGE